MNSLIGENIKKQRKAAGLTQIELAKRLGISSNGVSEYETGKRIPKIKTLQNIAAAIGCDLAALLPLSGIREESGVDEIVFPVSDMAPMEVVVNLTDKESKNEQELIMYFRNLNSVGQQKAVEYVADLSRIPEYLSVLYKAPPMPFEDVKAELRKMAEKKDE